MQNTKIYHSSLTLSQMSKFGGELDVTVMVWELGVDKFRWVFDIVLLLFVAFVIWGMVFGWFELGRGALSGNTAKSANVNVVGGLLLIPVVGKRLGKTGANDIESLLKTKFFASSKNCGLTRKCIRRVRGLSLRPCKMPSIFPFTAPWSFPSLWSLVSFKSFRSL